MTTREQHWLYQQLEPTTTPALLGGNMKQYKALPVTSVAKKKLVEWARTEQDAEGQEEFLKLKGIK